LAILSNGRQAKSPPEDGQGTLLVDHRVVNT